MQTIILGSGSPLPDPGRAGPSTLVRTGAGDLLFDCGRGVLMRAAAAGSAAGALRGLFLTHLHSDHTTDLNDIVTSRWITSFQPHPLPVYGPVGTASLLQATEAMLELDIGYRLAHHDDLQWRPSAEVVECERGTVLQDGGGPGHRRAHRSRPGPPHGGLPGRGGRAVGRHRRRHGPVRRAGRALRGGGHARAHRGAARPDPTDRAAAAPRRPRLPLVGRGRGADRGAQRRGHPRPHPPGPGAAARDRSRMDRAGRRRTSTARWSWPTTC